MMTLQMIEIDAAAQLPFSEGWFFSVAAAGAGDDSGKWDQVDIPHTWNAEDATHGGGVDDQSRDGYRRGLGWYRKDFQVESDLAGKRVFLRFQGVGSVADVYLNGVHLGQHQGAFTAFCFELTKHLKYGAANQLAVRADNTWREDVLPLSGDFPVFGGIYRPVDLVVKPTVCISPLDHGSPGIHVTQRDVGKNSAKVSIRALLDNSGEPVEAGVKFTIRAANGDVVAEHLAPVIVCGQREIQQEFVIANPRLWNGVRDPHLYQVEVAVIQDGKVADTSTQPLGLRTIRIDPEKGFFLNGEPYKLHGVSRHQDRADKGWAISPEDEEEDLALICEMGAQAVRTGHYPPSQRFFNFCDKLGLLVWTELPMVDCISDHPNLPGNARLQLVEMIRQLSNHPSIFCWGISNEMYHRKSPDATAFIKKLVEIARQEDSTRLTTCAVNKGLESLCKSTDIFAVNTYPGWYSGEFEHIGHILEKFNTLGGGRGVAVSEYGAGASIHHHEQNPAHPKAAGPWHPEEWQSLFHETTYRIIQETPYCWGAFIWNMFDFASVWRNEGDAPGINDKGLVTYDRKVKKDAFYFYKANWSKRPVLYITSRRHTTRTDALTPVKVYSNAKSVTLKVNGRTIGTKTIDKMGIAVWQGVSLEKGENQILVEAVKDGSPVSDSCVWTLQLDAEQPEPRHDKVDSGKHGS